MKLSIEIYYTSTRMKRLSTRRWSPLNFSLRWPRKRILVLTRSRAVPVFVFAETLFSILEAFGRWTRQATGSDGLMDWSDACRGSRESSVKNINQESICFRNLPFLISSCRQHRRRCRCSAKFHKSPQDEHKATLRSISVFLFPRCRICLWHHKLSTNRSLMSSRVHPSIPWQPPDCHSPRPNRRISLEVFDFTEMTSQSASPV